MASKVDLSDFQRSCDNIEGESSVLRGLAKSARNFGNSHIADELTEVVEGLETAVAVIKAYVHNDIQLQYQRQQESSNNMFTLAMGMGKLLDDVKKENKADVCKN